MKTESDKGKKLQQRQQIVHSGQQKKDRDQAHKKKRKIYTLQSTRKKNDADEKWNCVFVSN